MTWWTRWRLELVVRLHLKYDVRGQTSGKIKWCLILVLVFVGRLE